MHGTGQRASLHSIGYQVPARAPPLARGEFNAVHAYALRLAQPRSSSRSKGSGAAVLKAPVYPGHPVRRGGARSWPAYAARSRRGRLRRRHPHPGVRASGGCDDVQHAGYVSGVGRCHVRWHAAARGGEALDD